MSKITVKDLKELAKQLPQVKTFQIDEFSVDVKQHLPILEKIKLISAIFKSAIDEENTLQLINYNSLHIAYKVLVAKEYSNISLPKDTIQAYDILTSTGLYDKIYETIPSGERRGLEEILRNYEVEHKEKYERENTLPNIVKNMLNELIGKLPTADEAKKFIEDASKELNNLNPDNLKFVQDFLKVNRGENIGDI